ncbi:class I SAM-dependent methyltransferase [Curvivirga aplysinae]|uniref:class I SAM-dependent methyltransferase n=1 Tax=Curvivirga aplysinae TaxID=2529852 RepID=UPI0012BD3E1A|nr:methyltransferase domain-containing protein [Curvivirga aplysinae]MTI10275.1 hypothetical protein [Curvivirga aplysinae]
MHITVKERLAEKKSIQVVLGAGGMGPDGWIFTEFDDLDFCSPQSWQSFCPENSIDNLFSEHVLEHIDYEDCKKGLALAYKYLKPGGVFRIAVPDGFNPDPDYIDAVKVNGTGLGSDDHRILYTIESLSEIIVQAGFQITPLEYFDPAGKFHAVLWSNDQGRVLRSRRYDPRNTETEFNYSSLIVDAIRPIK